MNRIKIIYEIIKILASEKRYVSRTQIVERLSNIGIEVTGRRVKQYIQDIRDSFNMEVEYEAGPEGGVKIGDDSRKEIARVAMLTLDDDEKNALNDSFELAERHTNFHYSKDLQRARTTLYAKMQLKIQDYEYYVGVKNTDTNYTNILKAVKQYIINKEWVNMESSHDYFDIQKGLMQLKPVYVIHDSDETFVVLKDSEDKAYYQNLKNIKSIKGTKKYFKVLNEDISRYVNEATIKIKGKHKMKFKINDERGLSIFELWNYEFKDITKPNKNNIKEVIFYEEYKAHEFILRMIEHITLIDFPIELSLKWNTILSKQKYINVKDNGLIVLSKDGGNKVNNDVKYTYDGIVLKNKFKVREENSLHNLEEKVTKSSIQNNMESIRKLKWNDPETIKTIHKFIFGEIYDWAGEYREINISKNSTSFADHVSIASEIKRLSKENISTKAELISLYLKMNMVHPFREGNGRTTRLWLTIASEQILGLTIDFSKITTEDYMAAMITSEWNPRAIYELLGKTFVKFTDKNYQSIFIRSTDASYAYEGLKEFKMKKNNQ